MKRNYIKLWLLLAVAFAAVATISALSPVKIGGYELRDSGLYASLTAPRTSTPTTTSTSGNLPKRPAQAPEPLIKPAVVDSAPKTLLFIGDSMLEGLSPRLAAYAAHNGHKLYSVIWYSSTSEVWGRSGKLRRYISQFKPDFVFISLGANELFVKDIAAKRGKYVDTLLGELGNTPYLWIGPPNWKPDTGINSLVASKAAPGSFFLSDGMHFDRSADGAHPTHQSAIMWMDSVVSWMSTHVAKPFLLDKPTVMTARPTRTIVHQPNEQ